ncbi:MAG: TetR/AcrR family transcriptional regulator [Desulfobacterales bacterium]|jgi:AcrR family transcriptional regulator
MAKAASMKIKKLPRREREKLRHRQEILTAALSLFSEKGYHNVSMHEIANKAEFAIGTLYNFFENKEDLYKALVLEQSERYERALTKGIEEPDEEVEKLKNYIRIKTEWLRNNLPFVRLFLAERRGPSFNIKAGLDEALRTRHYAFMKKLAAIFAKGIKRKRFKEIADPFYLAVALDSALDAFLLLWIDAPERYSYPGDPDAILDIFFKGLLNP